mmetsp:Transcript_17346/g.47866  ORF Transcript_17346/g.47866 Transcript_17346/m.47866 type:complete len:619 (-) Transcript_17346:83-1939(-)
MPEIETIGNHGDLVILWWKTRQDLRRKWFVRNLELLQQHLGFHVFRSGLPDCFDVVTERKRRMGGPRVHGDNNALPQEALALRCSDQNGWNLGIRWKKHTNGASVGVFSLVFKGDSFAFRQFVSGPGCLFLVDRTTVAGKVSSQYSDNLAGWFQVAGSIVRVHGNRVGNVCELALGRLRGFVCYSCFCCFCCVLCFCVCVCVCFCVCVCVLSFFGIRCVGRNRNPFFERMQLDRDNVPIDCSIPIDRSLDRDGDPFLASPYGNVRRFRVSLGSDGPSVIPTRLDTQRELVLPNMGTENILLAFSISGSIRSPLGIRCSAAAAAAVAAAAVLSHQIRQRETRIEIVEFPCPAPNRHGLVEVFVSGRCLAGCRIVGQEDHPKVGPPQVFPEQRGNVSNPGIVLVVDALDLCLFFCLRVCVCGCVCGCVCVCVSVRCLGMMHVGKEYATPIVVLFSDLSQQFYGPIVSDHAVRSALEERRLWKDQIGHDRLALLQNIEVVQEDIGIADNEGVWLACCFQQRQEVVGILDGSGLCDRCFLCTPIAHDALVDVVTTQSEIVPQISFRHRFDDLALLAGLPEKRRAEIQRWGRENITLLTDFVFVFVFVLVSVSVPSSVVALPS